MIFTLSKKDTKPEQPGPLAVVQMTSEESTMHLYTHN